MKEKFSFNSFDELVIQGYKWRNDQVEDKVLVISHGMAETIARYEVFANYLLDKGYAVYGIDQRGHGQTAITQEKLGCLGEDGWFRMKEDLKQTVDIAKRDYPSASIYVLGHSMGSFLVRDFLIDYSHEIDGVILSGTGYTQKTLLRIGNWMSKRMMNQKGPEYISPFIDRLTFGGYNKKIDNQRTDFDWLTRDNDIVDAYIDDDYCGQVHPVGYFYTFTHNLIRILYKDYEVGTYKSNLPMLILSGDSDPVGDYGKGVHKTKAYYDNHGFDTQMKLYPSGRHEILNELNREEVFMDIDRWISNLE